MSIFVSIIDSPIDINNLIKWENKYGKAKCSSEFYKNNNNLIGRFVKKQFIDDSIYIIPLCEEHKNELNGGIYVNDKTNFL